MSNDWTIYVIIGVAVVMLLRMDRLGIQLQAVATKIVVDLTPDEDRKQEILAEWKRERNEEKKERRS